MTNPVWSIEHILYMEIEGCIQDRIFGLPTGTPIPSRAAGYIKDIGYNKGIQ